MLPVPNSRGTQCLFELRVARLMYAISIVDETSSSATVSSTKQGSYSDIVRSGPTPEGISKPSWLLANQRAREIGRKL